MVWLYSLTLGLSALLLFWVQPMFARMVLPLLGGAPAVWNVAMVFFQAALLAGYLYSHLSTRWLGPRGQAALHLPLLALALLALPIAVAPGWQPPATTPAWWLLGLLTVSLGAPFFMVATTAPLLQRWFAASGHRDAHNPYFLYGASNIGSIAALLGYPLLLEPLARLSQQSSLWTAGYVALIAGIGLCAIVVLRRRRPSGPSVSDTKVSDTDSSAAKNGGKPEIFNAVSDTPVSDTDDTDGEGRVGWRRCLHWLALAFVPSGLLLATTQHLTTDVVAIPLFWVVPLALYLLTYVIVFARRPLLRQRWMLKLQPLLLIALALTFYWQVNALWFVLPLHLAAFFVTAMVCHGELAARRPAVDQLTAYYLWMAVGGVLGGSFTALLAPLLFDTVLEYPLLLVAACLLRPNPTSTARAWLLDLGLPLLLLGTGLLPLLAYAHLAHPGLALIVGFYVAYGLFAYAQFARPLRAALALSALLLAGFIAAHGEDRVLVRERSFFGVHRVEAAAGGALHLLQHGTTVHGAQYTEPARWREPLTYYTADGPLGQLFAWPPLAERLHRVGAIGLGAGAIACYRQPGQVWSFLEIDPVVVRLARDTRYFHYLSECAPEAEILLGDGRLTLEHGGLAPFDLLVLDAFSSDAIPLHLLTREAFALYLRQLTPRGVLMVHITNRHLDLRPVLASLAADAGLAAVEQSFTAPDQGAGYPVPTRWVAMARAHELLPPPDGRWQPLPTAPGQPVWRDDFANILGPLMRKYGLGR